MDKANYVLGFLFTRDNSRVVLIQKKRPVELAGKWNGVGGHIEEGESSVEAMTREFCEEAGLSILDWQYRLEYRLNYGTVHIFTAQSDTAKRVCQIEDEAVKLVDVANIRHIDVVPNLHWMIPLLLDEFFVEGNLLGSGV